MMVTPSALAAGAGALRLPRTGSRSQNRWRQFKNQNNMKKRTCILTLLLLPLFGCGASARSVKIEQLQDRYHAELRTLVDLTYKLLDKSRDSTTAVIKPHSNDDLLAYK